MRCFLPFETCAWRRNGNADFFATSCRWNGGIAWVCLGFTLLAHRTYRSNEYLPQILGLLQSSFGLTAYDAVSHMVEEMPQPHIKYATTPFPHHPSKQRAVMANSDAFPPALPRPWFSPSVRRLSPHRPDSFLQLTFRPRNSHRSFFVLRLPHCASLLHQERRGRHFLRRRRAPCRDVPGDRCAFSLRNISEQAITELPFLGMQAPSLARSASRSSPSFPWLSPRRES